MSSDDECYLPCNDFTILDEDEKSFLIKIEFRAFIRQTKHWNFNRDIDEEKVNEYYDSLKENNNIKWSCTGVKEKKGEIFHLIDGQHRYEAIKRYLQFNDIEMICNRSLFMFVYNIEDIDNDIEYITELFKKINNNKPLNIQDLPSLQISKLTTACKKDPILSKGISDNKITLRSHEPKIHMRQLKSFFAENLKYIEGMTNEEIIKNIKYLNNRLSLMPITSIFESRDINERNKKIYDTACSLGFFIRIENSKKFAPKKWIKKINDIESLFSSDK